jgi:hypothetical protein
MTGPFFLNFLLPPTTTRNVHLQPAAYCQISLNTGSINRAQAAYSFPE